MFESQVRAEILDLEREVESLYKGHKRQRLYNADVALTAHFKMVYLFFGILYSISG